VHPLQQLTCRHGCCRFVAQGFADCTQQPFKKPHVSGRASTVSTKLACPSDAGYSYVAADSACDSV
jgi:hypothetical protein